MTITVKRNDAGNCINFEGSSNPVYWNACLSAEVDGTVTDSVNIINDIVTADTGITQYEFFRIPYTQFRDASGVAFESAQAAADYITTNGNVAGAGDINVGYRGVFDASAEVDPDDESPNNGDWYYIGTEGTINTVAYAVNDIIKYNSTSTEWEKIESLAPRVTDIEDSALDQYNIHVDGQYTGTVRTGSSLHPYNDLSTAIAASSEGHSILVKGINTVASEVVLPHSLHFYGVDNSEIKYANYSASNGDILSFVGTDNTKQFSFKNIIFKNAGGYGLVLKKTAKVSVEDCQFLNNGWNGTQLNTVLSSASSGLLGYDSTNTALQAFYAGPSASDGGALRIDEATAVEVISNTVRNNLRGIRVQDCGVGGYGFITRNVSASNIESGIYVAAGDTHSGCQNVVVSMNSASYNASNGLLVVGGINNKFSQNEVNGNWNAGFCAWGSANTTLRDCGLYDNNRSAYSGIGNAGDAKASIQINEAYNYLSDTISLNAAARFIVEVLDTQVHYTGLGSNTVRTGLFISSEVGNLADDDKNIIKIDDVGFIGQDYALDFSEVDLNNLRVSLGDNSYQSIGSAAVRPPLLGNYSELPYSNHVMQVPSLNVVVDPLKMTLSLREYVSGNVINVYATNELQGVDRGTHVDIIQKSSDRIQLRGLTFGNVYINGVQAGTDVNSMNDTLNAAFQMDLTQYQNFLVSEVGVNAGQSLPAQADNWYIAYGSRATEQVAVAGVVLDLEDQQPFYNGNFLSKGREYTWTHSAAGSYMIGVWSGAESAHDESSGLNTINWTPGFRFVDESNRFSGTDSAGVDIGTRHTSGDSANVTADGQYDVVGGSTTLALRYGNDNYLYLIDITGGDEYTIGKSNSPLVGGTATVFFAGENQPNAQFPVMQERTDRWTIVHDFDDSEGGEWADGIEEDTVMRSNMEISPGEKVTMNFNYFGRGEVIGFSYAGAATAEAGAPGSIGKRLFYNQAEAIKGIEADGDWTWNLSATHSFDPNGDQSDVGYWKGGGTNLGLISWRYKTDNTLEMWHETENELMATLTAPLDGNPFKVYFGAIEAMPTERLPTLTKYDMTAVEEGANIAAWYYIESPDGTFTYPLFSTDAEANHIDSVEGGSGTSQGYSFPDDPTSALWYGPDTSFISDGTSAPSHGVYGESTNVLWNEIPTNADSTAVPTAFSNSASLDELTALNLQIHPVDATFTTTIHSAPSWVSQATNNANITGTAPEVGGDSTNYPSVDYTVTVVRTNAYGSSTGTLTITVNNVTALVSLPGTLHTGSVVAGTAVNSAGNIYTGVDSTSGQFVYDIGTLEDGDKIEWYHQEQFYCFGIVSAGIDKTTDVGNKDVTSSARWDLLAPITGVPSNTQGQNFGNAYSMAGLVPVGWDDNTNPQAIPTRPVYASSDVWKLYNNAGTIELSLNGALFRSSSATHTDPVITLAYPAFLTEVYAPMPQFTHTANSASAPSGFAIEYGTMDTSSLLSGDSVASLSNLSLSPGQRFITTRTWWDTNVLPYIDGSAGEDNKVFVGIPKAGVTWTSIVEQDFYASHRAENQTANLTKLTQYYAGPTPSSMHLNRASDTDIGYNMAIEFTREGDLVTMRSLDSSPSLITEPVGGTFGETQTWSGAHTTTGTSALDLVIATKESQTGAQLYAAGLSVITAPSKANEFDVTEDTSSLPLFNGDPAGDITLAAGSTYKFWLHSDSIESTDSLGICLISDNSDYTTGVTVVGTPGSFGSYVEFAIPADVPPVKFKWTSGGVAYYVTPGISGSTYSAGVTGITLEGPSANQSGTEIVSTTSGHGWVSIDETLGAGERLVMDGAFFADLLAETPNNYDIAIGLKGDNWANTQHTGGSNQITTGMFKGDAYLNIRKTSTSTTYWQVFTAYGNSNSMLTNTSALVSTVGAFIEVTGSGNNIRIAFGRNGSGGFVAGDESTKKYGDWTSYKAQTGEQGYGITNLDVMVGVNAVFSSATFDGGEVDWTGLSEVSVPTTPANATDWNKALDFSGSNEHAKQVSTSMYNQAIQMAGLANLVDLGTSPQGETSSNSSSRPWATSVVFKSDGHSSNQIIWVQGEGASNNNDNIYLQLTSSGDVIFAWGREGVGYNKCRIAQNISSSNWYGVAVAHSGVRLGGNDASAANLANCFDIRLMSSADSFGSVSSNLSTSSNWINTGVRMDRTVAGAFSIGGHSNTSYMTYRGKIASMVITTLLAGGNYTSAQLPSGKMPDGNQLKMMIMDPVQWLDDYKVRYSSGNPNGLVRATTQLGASQPFLIGSGNSGYAATQVWLMGDGASDSYANGIRNYLNPGDQNQTKMQLNNMQSNDIETVSIPGLT